MCVTRGALSSISVRRSARAPSGRGGSTAHGSVAPVAACARGKPRERPATSPHLAHPSPVGRSPRNSAVRCVRALPTRRNGGCSRPAWRRARYPAMRRAMARRSWISHWQQRHSRCGPRFGFQPCPQGLPQGLQRRAKKGWPGALGRQATHRLHRAPHGQIDAWERGLGSRRGSKRRINSMTVPAMCTDGQVTPSQFRMQV